jgi:predicted enzyme related to lactoylglutathione lyase
MAMVDTGLGRIVWYELLTTDMKAAESFYSKVVGWQTSAFDQTPQPYHMFMREGDIPTGGVMDIPEGMNFPPHWGMYVAVDKLEDAVAKIKQLGGKELSPIIDVPTVGRMQTVLDPQGAAFSVYEAATPHQPDAPRQVGDVSWHELMTSDAEAALKFYSQMFGWQESTAMDMGPMGKYHIFKGGAYDLGGMMNKSKEMAQVPPHWGIYFRVPDVDEAAERVKAHGGKVLNGPMEVPGGSRIVNCQDPQGAYFSLHSLKG